jgi:hypothetical protein
LFREFDSQLPVIYLNILALIELLVNCILIVFLSRVEGVVEVFYISMCSRGFFNLPSAHPSLINQPACSFEVLFGQMLESVVARDRSCMLEPDLYMANLRSSVRLVCALWPVKVNVIQNANLCLEVDNRVEDAYRLLQVFLVRES